MISYLFVLLVGLVAGLISGIIGTGASVLLIPTLVYTFGPKETVPIMAVAAVMVNLAKMLAWWREVDWRAFAAYSIAGVPAAALGARTLLALPTRVIDVALGVFFIVMVPGRRWLAARQFRFRLWHLALAGAVIGYLTGIVVSTGPLSVPAFLAYGLTRGAFLSTEAAGSIAVFLSKAVTFRGFGALPAEAMLHGLIVGSSLMAGSFAARLVVLRMSPENFRQLLDGVMLVAGLSILWDAIR